MLIASYSVQTYICHDSLSRDLVGWWPTRKGVGRVELKLTYEKLQAKIKYTYSPLLSKNEPTKTQIDAFYKSQPAAALLVSTARALQEGCKSTARGLYGTARALQEHYKRAARALQEGCMSTARGLQKHCKRAARAL
ncbi:hypothetical protein ACROYT_G012042 [Oculina patagonica]